MRRIGSLTSRIAVSISLLSPVAAYAQDGAAEGAAVAEQGSHSESNDIVVTAQRTSSTLQSTPIALSAFSDTILQERQILDVQQIAAQVPGLVIQSGTGTTNAARIVLRGIGQENHGVMYDPAVGVYIDNVYEPRTNGAFFSLYDVERVEVLRGPQGTLYGRNSSGGAIKIITKRPSQEFTARGDVSFGNRDAFLLRTYVSGPIVQDVLAASMSVVREKRDGFVDAPAYGRKMGKKDKYTLRGKLLFTPTDTLEIEVAADYQRDKSDPAIGVPLSVSPGVINPNASPDRDLYSSELSGPYAQGLKSYGGSINASLELSDAVTLTSTTGYRKLDVIQSVPFSQRAGTTDLGTDYVAQNENFSQEFNLQLDLGRLSGVLGVYYFDETGNMERGFLGYAVSHLLDRKTEAYAAFVEGKYEVVDDLFLIGGLRYTEEDAFFSQFYYKNISYPQSESEKFKAWTPKLGFNWNITPRLMAYATYTKGFKSGGFNTISPTSILGGAIGRPLPYNPEHVDSYEAGFKFQTDDRRFRLNAALFQADYKSLQLPVFFPGTVVTYTDNAAGARIRGLELEPSWTPIDGLNLYGAMSFNTGKYTDDFICSTAYTVRINCREKRIKGLIPRQITVGASYEAELSGVGWLKIGSDYVYTSRYYNNVSNDLAFTASDELGLLNGFVRWTDASKTFSVTLEGKNLTKKQYYQSTLQYSNATSPAVIAFPGDPRSIAVRFGFEF